MIIKNDNSTLFGSYIRKKRLTKGLSIRNMASLLDISPIYLCDIELGKRKPPVKNDLFLIYKIIDILGIPEEETENVINLAYLSYGKISDEITSYLLTNESAMEFIKMASELNLTNEFWDNLTGFIGVSDTHKVYEYKRNCKEKK